ncbi:c-type cytochrome [Phototrophicus methaneseepsis]|uniref:C-type cytochrome n=1 Tax=Phototrophicus methaneseepsis TaxID=2710758 RepID=A0A7S8EE16_9CHLR|nr:c-type cytochrome [Phototrophicus methaneseepsis]
MPAGDAEQGRELIRQYGCSACHAVPNVAGPQGTTGPSLAHIAEQSYIAGVLTNTPQNLITWIQFPQEVDPQTAMPHVGVSYDDAVDIAAYLYSLDSDR